MILHQKTASATAFLVNCVDPVKQIICALKNNLQDCGAYSSSSASKG